MGKKKLTDEQRRRMDQAMVNAERTRKLAEKAQAELDRKHERESA